MRNKRKATSLPSDARQIKKPKIEGTSITSESLHAKFESEEEENPSLPVQQADAQSDPLTSLPFEATQNIFSFLSQRELASAQLVSQSWDQSVTRYKKERFERYMKERSDREFSKDRSFQKSRTPIESDNARMDLEEEEPKKAVTIAVIDKELLDHIFTFLPLKELIKTKQVCRSLNNIINSSQSWQKRIRNGFPYLEKTQNEEFNENPKALYIKGYKQYQIWKHEFKTLKRIITEKEFKAALNGEVPAVETTSREKYKTLCEIAMGNGHHQFKASSEALCYAVTIGNFSTVQYLIKEKDLEKDLLPYLTSEAIYFSAIKYKHFEIVKFIKEIAKIINNTLNYKIVVQNLFCQAATLGQREVLDYIWDQFSELDLIDNIALTNAIMDALKNKHSSLAEYLTKKAKNSLTSTQKEEIISFAAEKGSFEIMKSLWQDNSQVPHLEQEKRLRSAVEERHHDIVVFLLEKSNNISPEFMGTAIEIALKQASQASRAFSVFYYDIAQCIAKYIPDSPIVKSIPNIPKPQLWLPY